MFLVHYSLLNSQNISVNSSEKMLVTRTPPTQLKKLQKLQRKRSSNWPMVSFNHNGSEIISWRGIASKPKAQNPKQHFQDEYIFFEPQAADHQVCTRTLELYADSLKQLFLQLHLRKKYIQQFTLPKVFFCKFVDRIFAGLMPKYYLLAGDSSQVSIFFLHKIKISKQDRFSSKLSLTYISEVFTILCGGIRNTIHWQFQNKSVSSSFK